MNNNDMFFKYVESRGNAGYKSALLVKEHGEDKYSLLIASTSVPAVFGSQNSFEFDLLNSPVIGKIQGKSTLDDKEVEFLLHRDNVFRLEQLRGKVLDFMYFTPDFMGWEFTGKISYRPNDAGADTLMGTYTITPMSASDRPIIDARGMVKETLCFKDAIPESVKSGDSINLSVVQTEAVVTYDQQKLKADGSPNGESTSLTVSNGVATISLTGGGLVAITASATGYASWTTTIYVTA